MNPPTASTSSHNPFSPPPPPPQGGSDPRKRGLFESYQQHQSVGGAGKTESADWTAGPSAAGGQQAQGPSSSAGFFGDQQQDGGSAGEGGSVKGRIKRKRQVSPGGPLWAAVAFERGGVRGARAMRCARRAVRRWDALPARSLATSERQA